MSALTVRTVDVNGRSCRIWEQGSGPRVYWLASSPMLMRQTAFHETMAAGVTLVTCGLPGFPGSEGHDILDSHLDWCLATRDLLQAAGFQPGDTLMGSTTAGALAADAAALWPELIGKLILIAPFGLWDDDAPSTDMFAVTSKNAPALFCENPERFLSQIATPKDAEPVLWSIIVNRGNESAARFLWPFGDTRLSKRLHRISAPTLLLWGAKDQVIPTSYANKFAEGIKGPASIKLIQNAGHLAELDEPAAVADAIFGFVG